MIKYAVVGVVGLAIIVAVFVAAGRIFTPSPPPCDYNCQQLADAATAQTLQSINLSMQQAADTQAAKTLTENLLWLSLGMGVFANVLLFTFSYARRNAAGRLSFDERWQMQLDAMTITNVASYQQPVPAHYSYQVLERSGSQRLLDPIEEPLQIAAPVLPAVGKWDFADVLRSGYHPKRNGILLAMSEADGSYITEQPNSICHEAHAGPTGNGKTNGMMLHVCQLAAAGQLVVLANPKFSPIHPRTGQDFRPMLPYLQQAPITNLDDIVALTHDAYMEINRRIARLNRGEDWEAPAIYYVIDELPTVAEHDPDFIKYLVKVIRLGREVEVFIITAAQDFLVKTLGMGSGARDNFRTAMYYGGDPYTAKALLGEAWLDETLGGGVAVIRSKRSMPQRARVPLLSNEAIKLLFPTIVDSETVPMPAIAITQPPAMADEMARNGGAMAAMGERERALKAVYGTQNMNEAVANWLTRSGEKITGDAYTRGSRELWAALWKGDQP